MLGKGKLDLGHEEVATLRADLILRFTSQSVLVVDQFASSHFEGLALTRKLNLAAIDYHLGCFGRWVNSFFSCDKFASLNHHTRLFRVGSLEFRPSLKHLEKLFSLHLCDFCFLWQGFVGGLFLSQLLRRPQRLLPGAIRVLVRILRLYNAVLLFVTFILAALTFGWTLEVLSCVPIFSALTRFQSLRIRIVSSIDYWFFITLMVIIFWSFLRKLHQFCGSFAGPVPLIFFRGWVFVLSLPSLRDGDDWRLEIIFLTKTILGWRFTFTGLFQVSLTGVLQLFLLELRVRPFAGHIWV